MAVFGPEMNIDAGRLGPSGIEALEAYGQYCVELAREAKEKEGYAAPLPCFDEYLLDYLIEEISANIED